MISSKDLIKLFNLPTNKFIEPNELEDNNIGFSTKRYLDSKITKKTETWLKQTKSIQT